MSSKLLLKKIIDNPYLITFCNKILSYNIILENESDRNMFCASLISADTLIDEHACDETIDIANFILNNIDLMILEDSIKKSTIEYMKTAINIATRDKKEFERNLR